MMILRCFSLLLLQSHVTIDNFGLVCSLTFLALSVFHFIAKLMLIVKIRIQIILKIRGTTT